VQAHSAPSRKERSIPDQVKTAICLQLPSKPSWHEAWMGLELEPWSQKPVLAVMVFIALCASLTGSGARRMAQGAASRLACLLRAA